MNLISSGPTPFWPVLATIVVFPGDESGHIDSVSVGTQTDSREPVFLRR